MTGGKTLFISVFVFAGIFLMANFCQAAIGIMAPDDFLGDGTQGSGTPAVIDINIVGDEPATYYLKAYFYSATSTSARFGYNFNPDTAQWIDTYSQNDKQRQISLDQNGNWSGEIQIKTDINRNGYLGAGDYILKIRATATTTSHVIQITKDISILEPAPLVNISPIADAGADQTAEIGDLVIFDGTNSSDPDGTIANYFWDFGDTTQDTGATTTHSYVLENIFTVTLTVTDDQGATSTDTTTITITAPAVVSVSTTTPATFSLSDIVINEFVSDPTAGQNEWIELYNNTTSTIDLTGWTIEDALGKILDLSGSIATSSFTTFETLSSKLNNTGDTIIIKDPAQNIIDQIAYGSNPPATKDPNSIARNTDGTDTDSPDDFAETTTPTKNTTNIITAPPEPAPTPSSNPGSGYTNSKPAPSPTNRTSYNPSDIVINEFVSDPIDDEEEWIEFYNNTDQAIDITDWTITEGAEKVTTLSGTIPAKATYTIEDLKGNLNNTGDIIILKDPDQNTIDQVAYGNWDDSNTQDNAIKSPDPKSTARHTDGVDTDHDYNDFRQTVPTKNAPNIISDEDEADPQDDETEPPEPAPDQPFIQIIITEILPNPAGSDALNEFIEIYNPNDAPVDLAGWQLDDAEGGSRPHTIGKVTIASHEYLVFTRPQTGLALNNTSDSVRLYDRANRLVDSMSYVKTKQDLSHSIFAGSWQQTIQITPGEENILKTINQAQTTTKNSTGKYFGLVDLKDIQNYSSGDAVTVRGVVSVVPGILGTQIFYIAGSGIQIYSYKKDFPALQVGDYIEVSGEISESGGEKRIKTKTKADIRFLEKQTPPEAHPMALSEIGEETEGYLVTVIGEVIEKKGSSVYIDDGEDEIKVYIKKATNMNTKEITEGTMLKVTGIVSQTKTGYRILPRNQDDVEITGQVKGTQEISVPTQTKDNTKYLYAIVIFLVAINGYLIFQNKKTTAV